MRRDKVTPSWERISCSCSRGGPVGLQEVFSFSYRLRPPSRDLTGFPFDFSNGRAHRFYLLAMCEPESPFSFKNSNDHIPVPLFAASVKQFSHGPPPTVRDPHQGRRKLPRIPPFLRHLFLTPTRCI